MKIYLVFFCLFSLLSLFHTVSAFETEFFISGLAPLADQLVTLFFVKENSDHMVKILILYLQSGVTLLETPLQKGQGYEPEPRHKSNHFNHIERYFLLCHSYFNIMQSIITRQYTFICIARTQKSFNVLFKNKKQKKYSLEQ